MENNSLDMVTLGAGTMVATMILKIVFDFLKTRPHDEPESQKHLERMAENIERQTEILNEIKQYHRTNSDGIKNLSEDLRELRQYIVTGQHR